MKEAFVRINMVNNDSYSFLGEEAARIHEMLSRADHNVNIPHDGHMIRIFLNHIVTIETRGIEE